MQKVTFKYECNSEYVTPRTYTIEFDSEGMIFDDFLDEVRRFALMMGYCSDTVKNAFNED